MTVAPSALARLDGRPAAGPDRPATYAQLSLLERLARQTDTEVARQCLRGVAFALGYCTQAVGTDGSTFAVADDDALREEIERLGLSVRIASALIEQLSAERASCCGRRVAEVSGVSEAADRCECA